MANKYVKVSRKEWLATLDEPERLESFIKGQVSEIKNQAPIGATNKYQDGITYSTKYTRKYASRKHDEFKYIIHNVGDHKSLGHILEKGTNRGKGSQGPQPHYGPVTERGKPKYLEIMREVGITTTPK